MFTNQQLGLVQGPNPRCFLLPAPSRKKKKQSWLFAPRKIGCGWRGADRQRFTGHVQYLCPLAHGAMVQRNSSPPADWWIDGLRWTTEVPGYGGLWRRACCRCELCEVVNKMWWMWWFLSLAVWWQRCGRLQRANRFPKMLRKKVLQLNHSGLAELRTMSIHVYICLYHILWLLCITFTGSYWIQNDTCCKCKSLKSCWMQLNA